VDHGEGCSCNRLKEVADLCTSSLQNLDNLLIIDYYKALIVLL